MITSRTLTRRHLLRQGTIALPLAWAPSLAVGTRRIDARSGARLQPAWTQGASPTCRMA